MTGILQSLATDDHGTRRPEDLLPLIYDELRSLAASYLRRERPDHTLQATELVHDAYTKLVDQSRVEWQGRTHFFAVAAQAMRRLLVDHARARECMLQSSSGECESMPNSSRFTTRRFTTRWTQSIGRLLPGIYDDLRELAARFMSRERADHTLQPTALVHEAFLRLSENDSLEVADQTHAKALAAQTMRRVLVDHARGASRQKRAGKVDAIPLDEERTPGTEGVEAFSALVGLDDAFVGLQRIDPRKARVVELRFFAGLSLEETARELGVSERTVTYDTRAACAWLKAEIAKGDSS